MARIDDDEEVVVIDRREFRRKRRIRNQIIAYASLVVILLAIAGGGFFGISKLVSNMQDKKHAAELAAQLEELSTQEQEPVAVEAPTSSEEPVEEESLLDTIVNSCIAEMPLEDKVAGLFMITPEALTGTDTVIKAGDTTQEKLSQTAVGGLIYFSKNIKSKEQLTEMLTNTKAMSKYPVFLAVDEEGGTVARVANSSIEVTTFEDMGTIGAGADPAKAAEVGTTIGTYLSELGFNVDFAPVADVLTNADNTMIGARSFGTDSGIVSSMVSSEVSAMESAGVSACLKHFPGLGDTTEDTHDGMATTERTLDDMRGSEFLSFQAGIDAGVDFVMVSHVSAPNVLGDNMPCSLSNQMITDVLRGELGYDGIVITDALDMAAVTDYYTSDQAAIMALQAGADMLLMPEDFQTAYDGVLAAVNDGTLTEDRIDESLRRIYRIKYADRAESE